MILRLLFLSLVLYSSALFAVEVPDNPKIAYLNHNEALLSTKAAAVYIESMKAEKGYKEDIESLLERQTELRKLQERVQRDRETMSEDEISKVGVRGNELIADIQHLGKKVRAREQSVQEVITRELAPKLEGVINDIISEQKIMMLVGPNAVLFASPDMNITSDVVKRLDASSGRKK